MNTLAQVMDEEVMDDGMEHAPISCTIFDPQGKVHRYDEVCACELHAYDVSTFPKGAYMIALDIPMMVH